MDSTPIPASGNAADAINNPLPDAVPAAQPTAASTPEPIVADPAAPVISPPLTSLVPAMTQVMTLAEVLKPGPREILFNLPMLHKLVNEHGQTVEGLLNYQKSYIEKTATLKDAPKIEDLRPEDALLLFALRTLDSGQHTTWASYKASMWPKIQAMIDERNPWLPSWIIKTEDKPHAWYSDMADGENSDLMSEQAKLLITELCRFASPEGKEPQATIGCPPTENHRFLMETIDGLLPHLRQVIISFGERPDLDFHFKWSVMITLLGGLGLPAMRRVAERLQEIDYEWNQVLAASDAELRELILKAQRVCGYPAALLRIPGNRLHQTLSDIQLNRVPQAVHLAFALHLMKHARFVPKDTVGWPLDAILVVFNGKRILMPVDPANLHTPLTVTRNNDLCANLGRLIGLPCEKPGRNDSDDPVKDAARLVLGWFTPSQLPRLRSMAEHPELILPPCVAAESKLELRGEYRWADHGLRIKPVARIDYATGILDRAACVEDEDSIALPYPVATYDSQQVGAWMHDMPERVEAVLPSTLILSMIKNIDDLGLRPGLAALIDILALLATSRSALMDSPSGSSLTKELPLVVVLPKLGTELGSTGNGKTTLATVLASIWAPGITSMVIPTRNSAPADRSATSDIKKKGTAVFDEFLLQRGDGIFSLPNMLSLATGGTIHPGSVKENADGVRLKFPLCMSMKFSNVPADFRNRQVAIFMHPLTDATRATDTEAGEIFTGRLALRARLSLELWKRQHHFVERMRAVPFATSSGWRFPVHALVAKHILDAEAEVAAYLKAAEAACDTQLHEAQVNGLVAAAGEAPRFDPVWFFANCTETILEGIYKSQLNRQYQAADMLKELVEDGGRREYARELAICKIGEQGAASSFYQKAKNARAGHWKLSFYDGKDAGGRARKFCRLVKLRSDGGELPQPALPAGGIEQALREQIAATPDLAATGGEPAA